MIWQKLVFALFIIPCCLLPYSASASCVSQSPELIEQNLNNAAFIGIVEVTQAFPDENGSVRRATLTPMFVYKSTDNFDLNASVTVIKKK